MTGSSWVPSEVQITKTADGLTQIRATRLISANWVPIIGGMNYCKILSSEGVAKLITDILATKEST